VKYRSVRYTARGGLWLAVGAALTVCGCLELVRRPPPVVARTDERPVVAVSPAGPVPAVRPSRPAAPAGDRSDKTRRKARQVNEYALWCIENGMWDEARLHLERATALDSLASSFHNNLGIVYERTGLVDQALVAYRQALVLAPGRESYVANLDRLESRQRRAENGAEADSLAGAEADSLAGAEADSLAGAEADSLAGADRATPTPDPGE
jgi:tetratricopeptide (TPR) repeat protein